MESLAQYLRQNGPSRSSAVVQWLREKTGISSEAARQRVFRESKEALRFPISMLPNREAFLYLRDQRKEESFWLSFLSAMRETNSIFGCAIDAFIAKQGLINVSEFETFSGAPKALKGQVSAERLAITLMEAGVIETSNINGENYYVCRRRELCVPDLIGIRARQLTEEVILGGLRDWTRKLGLASFNAIEIRGDGDPERRVGAFRWDLTGPSYLLPLKGSGGKPGFLVADVISDHTLNAFEIRYMIRKAQLLRGSLRNTQILPLLIADGFTSEALTKGHSEGLVLATPETLFGRETARGLKNLLETLKNAAAIAAANPERLLHLIDQLKEIEGASKNLRGILFELLAAHLAKVTGGSIEIGIKAQDGESGKTGDIDVLHIPHPGACISIECKAKSPGGVLVVEEVEKWLGRIPTFVAHLRSDRRYREADLSFEIWTTGTIESDTLSLLQREQKARTKYKINWKDGQDVLAIATKTKQKAVANALREHFIKHPLARISSEHGFAAQQRLKPPSQENNVQPIPANNIFFRYYDW